MLYEVRQTKRTALSLDRGLVTGSGFEVYCTVDNRVVYTTSHLLDPGARRLNGLRTAAVKMAKRYQAYYERTGKRFEKEQDAREGARHFEAWVKRAEKRVMTDLARDAFEAARDPSKREALMAKARALVPVIVEKYRKEQPFLWEKIQAYCDSTSADLVASVTRLFDDTGNTNA